MDAFLDDLAGLLESAEAASRASAEASDITILIGNEGVRMVSSFPGPLEAIRIQHGARIAYRITHRSGRVQVEGAASGRFGSLSSAPPPRLNFSLFSALPAYQTAPLSLTSANATAAVAN